MPQPLSRSGGSFDAAASSGVDVYGLTMKIAGNSYEGHRDMWDHVQAVERRIKARFKDHVTPDDLKLYRAAAVLHDLWELKRDVAQADGSKKRVHIFSREQWTARLKVANLPQSFIDTIDAMTHRQGEAYLDYIQRLARDPLGRTIKLYGDLPENRCGRRQLPSNPTQQLLDKKAYLYEMAEYYLEARRTNTIGDISVAQFIMESRQVPRHLKNEAILKQYSGKGTQIPRPVYAVPGESRVRRWLDGMMGYRLSIATRLSL